MEARNNKDMKYRPFTDDSGENSSHPEAITPKFNWGGISLAIPFAIANRTYLGLLVLIGVIPIVGWIFATVWCIISGLNVEKWALTNPANHYRDEKEFRIVMDGWNRSGLVMFIVLCSVVLIEIVVMLIIFGMTYSQQQIYYSLNP